MTSIESRRVDRRHAVMARYGRQIANILGAGTDAKENAGSVIMNPMEMCS